MAGVISVADKGRIEKGLEIGEKIGEALQDKSFTNFLQNVGTKMAPFLGALGPIMGLLLSFVSSGPTLEQKLMKRFDKLDKRFDRTDQEFDQVWLLSILSNG